MLKASDFLQQTNPLAEHYRQFRVGERLLLSGHSHQAWPDVAHEGVKAAWRDAAAHIDDKWQFAFEKADAVRRGFARLLNDDDGDYALGENTHTLIVRFLSALDLRTRPRIVTSDSEFHSLRRQLDRLAEEGIEIVRIPGQPYDSFAERITAEVDSGTAAVMVSSIFYNSGVRCDGLGDVMAACAQDGVELLVDLYHQLNVVPFDIRDAGLEQAFCVGGGYKYCQLGEGNCFLRIPPGCRLRPVITGWYTQFSELSATDPGEVPYGEGATRFAGATYDPTSHYRAVRVFDFFQEQGLTPELLREINLKQQEGLLSRFDALDLPSTLISRDKNLKEKQHGGFIAFNSPRADEIYRGLREQGVYCDYRGNTLRLGPAPYLSGVQLDEAMGCFEIVVRELV